jgi:hypothetical protein
VLYVSPDILYAGGRHHTTCNGEVDYNLSIHGPISGSCQAILVFVCIHPDRGVAKACQFKDILGLLIPGSVIRKRGRLDLLGSSEGH